MNHRVNFQITGFSKVKVINIINNICYKCVFNVFADDLHERLEDFLILFFIIWYGILNHFPSPDGDASIGGDASLDLSGPKIGFGLGGKKSKSKSSSSSSSDDSKKKKKGGFGFGFGGDVDVDLGVKGDADIGTCFKCPKKLLFLVPKNCCF